MHAPIHHNPDEADAFHRALKASPTIWPALQFVGITRGARPGEYHEQRNCPACQSTLTRPVSRDEALALVDANQLAAARYVKAL